MFRFPSLAKFFLTFVLLSLAFNENAPADVNHLPDDVRADLQKKHDFVILKKVSAIPAAGLAAFQASQGDHDYKMAEPGGKFQPSDVADKNLPSRQLEFAALSKNYLLIHHARGGTALGYYFVLLRKSGADYKVIWVGEGSRRYSSYSKFLKGLSTNTIDDRAGYAY